MKKSQREHSLAFCLPSEAGDRLEGKTVTISGKGGEITP
jgi:hypothetical protein